MMNNGSPAQTVDVLKTYGEHSDDKLKCLLFYGGLDTGIDMGRHQIPMPEKDPNLPSNKAVANSSKKSKLIERQVSLFNQSNPPSKDILGETIVTEDG